PGCSVMFAPCSQASPSRNRRHSRNNVPSWTNISRGRSRFTASGAASRSCGDSASDTPGCIPK
ncbi:MAG TPA: hypothetical protein DEB39_09430, partial [Planctomycetaceae bacterium]|nr:hypothetical protein [Planctomycetaceae bacterium]